MAKKSNPQDEKIEEMLHKALGRYQELLFKAANDKKDEDLYSYEQRFLRTMETGSNALKTAAKSVVDKYIPNIDTPVSTLLQSFGARYGGEEIKLTTYVRMVDMLTASVEQYRLKIDVEIRARENEGKVTTVGDLRNIILDDLKNDEITVVKYGNGTKIPVDKYASMLARTTRAETENLSMIQQALREGIDLVECDIVSPTCDTCAVYQGRVYSISGNDSRYPALYKTAFKSGYSIIHPNCRHSWSPYHTELYSEEERRQALERSNRTWKPDGDGRRFQQTETLREQYAKGQQKMRQWNAEIVEYERMKAHYKEIGQDPPYTTLGAFRREARKPREEQSLFFRSMRSKIAEEKTSQNGLTKNKKKNIISVGESKKQGAQIDCAVDWSAVNRKKYQDGIISLTEGKKILGTSVYKVSKAMLEHRQGTKQEDMYLLDARTGSVLYKDITTTVEMGIEKTPKLMSVLSQEDGNGLIIVHNHPMDGYPSATDFNALYENPKIKYGIIVGHKGTIYKYTSPQQRMQDIDIDVKVAKLCRKGYTKQEAEDRTYKELAELFGFKLEVIKNEK